MFNFFPVLIKCRLLDGVSVIRDNNLDNFQLPILFCLVYIKPDPSHIHLSVYLFIFTCSGEVKDLLSLHHSQYDTVHL